MDEIYKQQDIANKIANAISNPVGFGQDEHEVRTLKLSVYNLKEIIGWL